MKVVEATTLGRGASGGNVSFDLIALAERKLNGFLNSGYGPYSGMSLPELETWFQSERNQSGFEVFVKQTLLDDIVIAQVDAHGKNQQVEALRALRYAALNKIGKILFNSSRFTTVSIDIRSSAPIVIQPSGGIQSVIEKDDQIKVFHCLNLICLLDSFSVTESGIPFVGVLQVAFERAINVTLGRLSKAAFAIAIGYLLKAAMGVVGVTDRGPYEGLAIGAILSASYYMYRFVRNFGQRRQYEASFWPHVQERLGEIAYQFGIPQGTIDEVVSRARNGSLREATQDLCNLALSQKESSS